MKMYQFVFVRYSIIRPNIRLMENNATRSAGVHLNWSDIADRLYILKSDISLCRENITFICDFFSFKHRQLYGDYTFDRNAIFFCIGITIFLFLFYWTKICFGIMTLNKLLKIKILYLLIDVKMYTAFYNN